jgi:hypothetical protein
MYETPNRGTILEPKILRTKEQPTGDWAFLVRVGEKKELWIRGPPKCLNYKRWSPMKGIRSYVYPRERVIHVFQVPFNVQD